MQPACDTLTTRAAAHFRRPMPSQFGDTSRPARRANEALGAGDALGLTRRSSAAATPRRAKG